MEYDNQCGGCIYYEFVGDGVKGYCSWYKSYYYPGDNCEHQRTDSSSCYITTIICDVLGFEDDCSILNTLRYFRDNTMQKDIKYLPLLLEYDVIGPQIANNIQREYSNTKDIELWTQFYNFYLVQTANLIKENKQEEAVNCYIEMVSSLKEYFALENVNLKNMTNEYDISIGGHGKLKILK